MTMSRKPIAAAIIAALAAAMVLLTAQASLAQPGPETSTTQQTEEFASPYSEVGTSCVITPAGSKSVSVDADLYNFGTVVLGYEINIYYTNSKRSWRVQELGVYDVYPWEEGVTINLLTLDRNTVKYLGKKYKYFSVEINVLDTATSFASDWTKVKGVRRGAVCNLLLPGEGVEGL